MGNTVFTVDGKTIKQAELTSVLTDLLFFGVQWDQDGNTFVYNYIDNRWELFSDRVMMKYLLDRRKKIGIDLRNKKELAIVKALRYLAKQMRISDKWNDSEMATEVTEIIATEEMPEMQWEVV